jgi:hypothetical protein
MQSILSGAPKPMLHANMVFFIPESIICFSLSLNHSIMPFEE